MLITVEQAPWWYDLAKWGLATLIAGAGGWGATIATKTARTVKTTATIELVDKHDVRLRSLEDAGIRTDMRLSYIEQGIKKLLSRRNTEN